MLMHTSVTVHSLACTLALLCPMLTFAFRPPSLENYLLQMSRAVSSPVVRSFARQKKSSYQTGLRSKSFGSHKSKEKLQNISFQSLFKSTQIY